MSRAAAFSLGTLLAGVAAGTKIPDFGAKPHIMMVRHTRAFADDLSAVPSGRRGPDAG
jgi:hypothetical protein